MQLDVAIVGGGVTGLWALDLLSRSGYRCLLLESQALGAGQTVASQGIIHGGLKYSLRGVLSRSAHQIREMPIIWRKCLAGECEPNLSSVKVRSQNCYLWRTESMTSKFGMFGARIGLRVTPESVEQANRPAILRSISGAVYSMPEQVIDPADFLRGLKERNRSRILKVEPVDGLSFDMTSPQSVRTMEIRSGDFSQCLQPKMIVFAAGKGNGELRTKVGLDEESMQTRPLHMVMLKGRSLPEFNGHCVDGAKTRVTITSDRMKNGHVVWQIGGQIAEKGVAMHPAELISHTSQELAEVLPELDQSNLEWATYRVDRAEGKTVSGSRPEDPVILQGGNVITVWPTKLAFAPSVAESLKSRIETILPQPEVASQSESNIAALDNWPRPQVAQPPWELASSWMRSGELPDHHSTNREAA